MQPANRVLLVPLSIIAAILVGWLLHVGAAILQPLVIALLLATMLSPLLRALARWKIPPIVSVLVMVTLLFLGLFQLAVLAQTSIATFLRDTPLPAQVRTDSARGSGLRLPEMSGGTELTAQTASGDPIQVGTPTEQPFESAADPALAGGAQTPADPGDLAPGDSAADGLPANPADGVLVDAQAGESGEPVGDVDESRSLVRELRDQQEEAIRDAGGLAAIIEKLVARIESSSLPEPVVGYLRTELQELKSDGRAAEVAQVFLGGGLTLSRTLILVLVYMVFIFAEASVFKRKILAVAGDSRDDAERILETIAKGMQQFLGIKTLISIATGACAYLLLVLLKIPYALLFGFLTLALNFIPYFGSLLAGILPTVVAIAIEPTLDKAVITAVGYFSINTLLGTIVEPRIMGRQLDMSPLVIIVSVVVWGSLWGVVGAFLAVPIMATLQIIFDSSEHTRSLAVLLSSGPPKDSGRRIFRRPPPNTGAAS